MYPRIQKSNKKDTAYEYLVISESIRIKGKGSTTRNIANLGNIKKFKDRDINKLIDGLIKIFGLEKYALSEDVEIIESLEHGSIIFWQKIWDQLGLSQTIKKLVRLNDRRIKLEVEKYVQMMTINRCVDPLSKLAVTRWAQTTCYKQMKEYAHLPLEVTYFYRSMDQLLKIKDDLELEIFKKLRALFTVNVKLTFYDITSTFFYTDSCPISENGYSRDNRPDREQIVIGVVTSWEGYPIKHFVFTGNTKDETTVKDAIENLKNQYHIEETTFVGDRGMITKLNLNMIESEGFDYIMGVKIRQDEICEMLFSELDTENFEDYKDLKVNERKIKIKEFLIWKIKQLLKKDSVVFIDEKIDLLQKQISALNNEQEPNYQNYKTILKEVTQEIDSKTCQKIFRLIKKYFGRYEDELRYIICFNKERGKIAWKRREENISKYSKELDKLFSKDTPDIEIVDREKSLIAIFEGYKSKYKKFFRIQRDKKSKKAEGYILNTMEIEKENKLDGIFILLTTRNDLDKAKVVESYKGLKEIEILFDDFKNFVEIRPIRHWLEVRVRAHVFICILSLLLKRILEIRYLESKSVTEPLELIAKSKLIKYKVKFSEREHRSKEFVKVTNMSPIQRKYFNLVGIKHPMSLEGFVW